MKSLILSSPGFFRKLPPVAPVMRKSCSFSQDPSSYYFFNVNDQASFGLPLPSFPITVEESSFELSVWPMKVSWQS